MRHLPIAAGVAYGLVALSLMASRGVAQSSFVARLSADTVEVGEAFSLLVRVPVPAGSVVQFPDTVARTDFLESHEPVRWEAEPDAGGGAVLTLEYPVLAFGVGMVPVPGFDVFVRPLGGDDDGAPLPGGSFVGAWSEAQASGVANVRPLRVPRRGVWVNPVFTPEQVEAGVQPMPSADVMGPSWHRPSVLAGVGFLGLLAYLLARAALVWLGRLRTNDDGGREHWTPASARRHALDELDRLREEGLVAAGRVHELYTRSSGVVRRYVSRVRPECGVDLTSSELMSRLDDTARQAEPAPIVLEPIAVEPIVLEMGTAEVVKFGRLRPPRDTADEHLRALREWLAGPGTPTPP